MYTGGDNVSGYRIRHGKNYLREDGDGRVHMMAHAGALATANYAKILTFVSSASNPLVGVGFFATAVFTTGLTSATAAQHGCKAYVGVPVDTVASDTDGWFQIAGPYIGVKASLTDYCINGPIKWSGANFQCSATYGSDFSSDTSLVNIFGISLSSISAGTYDWYLIGDPITGLG
jgi:hypothetical protein